MISDCSAASLRSARRALTDAPLSTDDVARIDELRALEELKCAIEGRQAALGAAFDASQRAAAAAHGVRAERQGRGIAHQVALARRTSPHRGQILLGAAVILHREMPHTLAALRAGQITEWRAITLVRETACLDLPQRQHVDALLAADADALVAMSDRELLGRVRALAIELDNAAVARRREAAVRGRRVGVRPAPDGMGYLTALVPIEQAVACYAALKAGALDNAGMADLLVQRLTGLAAGEAVPVAINLVMSDRALWATSDEAADLADIDEPIPAELARDLACQAAESTTTRVWLRRLYANPGSGELVGMDARARLFPAGLARFIRLRDRRCRVPWCGAPIRHIDHVEPVVEGGATTVGNGQGLCVACNHAKQAPGWHTSTSSGPGHSVQTTTPTGHTYLSRPPEIRLRR